MRIRIEPHGLSVIDPDDFAGFSVVTALTPAELHDRVRTLGLGRSDGDHVWLEPQAIRAAIGSPTQTWDSGFAAMTSFAAKHGWLDDEGRIRAHIEPDTQREQP